jgi:glucosamine--fructose-6-phosphate aminotransferase (isomerizing)
LRTAHEVEALAGIQASDSALNGYLAIQQALSAIDRMEVRGRDSAGVGVVVWGHGLTEKDVIAEESLTDGFTQRHADALFTSRSVRVQKEVWTFVYKAAAEIGELGDNTRSMRNEIRNDMLLRRILAEKGARVTIIGHTRWASVGIISEPNAHPVTGEELNKPQPLVLAVLNGDVDNYADLKVEHDIHVAPSITTDAKVIPSLVARSLAEGVFLHESFINTVSQFVGSVAIAAVSVEHPDKVMLALRGSGQGMCIGIAEGRFIVARNRMEPLKTPRVLFVWMVNLWLTPIGHRVVGKSLSCRRNMPARLKESDALAMTEQKLPWATTMLLKLASQLAISTVETPRTFS